MKPTRTAALLISLICCLVACGDRGKAGHGEDTVTISVIGTNDVHGRISGHDGAGGLAVFGGYVANLRDARAANSGALLLVGAGDMWQGTLESNIAEGAPMVAAYNALRYDAVAIGNHEFDFGPEGPAAMPQSDDDDPRGALKARAAEADFPFLAANLIDESTGKAVDWPNVRPSYRVDAAGVAIGIIGLTSESTLSTTLSANVVGLRIADLAQTIREEAVKLRADGAKLVIVTAHAGGECTDFDDPLDLSACEPNSEIFRVAQALPEGLVDLIIAGHVHKGIAHEVNGIPVISSWAGGLAFGRVDFDLVGGNVVARRIFSPQLICSAVHRETGDCTNEDAAESDAAIYEGSAVIPDPAVMAVVAPAIAIAATVKNEKLGPILDTPLQRQPEPESAIGNFFTDVMLASASGADVAIHNTLGGIRDDLPAGEITYGDVYEMFPFDNRIVHLQLSGKDLHAIVANQLTSSRWRANVSGVRVFADCSGGALVTRIVLRNGEELQDDDQLLLVTNDFLVAGGDDVLTPATPENGFMPLYEGPQVREIIVDWLRKRSGRLNAADYADDTNPRWNFARPAPLVCEAAQS
jgi:5'-nucleotidase